MHVGNVLCLLRDVHFKYFYSRDTGCSVIPLSYLKMSCERFLVKNNVSECVYQPAVTPLGAFHFTYLAETQNCVVLVFCHTLQHEMRTCQQ